MFSAQWDSSYLCFIEEWRKHERKCNNWESVEIEQQKHKKYIAGRHDLCENQQDGHDDTRE